jgi:hypothetical protein
MAVHDTACVPVLEEGRAGADPYRSPGAVNTEPGIGCSCPGIRSVTRFGKGRERVRALLEIQLRPEGPGVSAPAFRRRQHRTGSPPAGESVPGAKVLPFPPPASS